MSLIISQQDIDNDLQGIDYEALEQAAGTGDLIQPGDQDN
jgi:hypothetical protein